MPHVVLYTSKSILPTRTAFSSLIALMLGWGSHGPLHYYVLAVAFKLYQYFSSNLLDYRGVFSVPFARRCECRK